MNSAVMAKVSKARYHLSPLRSKPYTAIMPVMTAQITCSSHRTVQERPPVD